MPPALTVLLGGPGVAVFIVEGIRMALASGIHVTYSSQTLMSQMPFIRSVGHASTDSNTLTEDSQNGFCRCVLPFSSGLG